LSWAQSKAGNEMIQKKHHILKQFSSLEKTFHPSQICSTLHSPYHPHDR
jgi:hypothetical protein